MNWVKLLAFFTGRIDQGLVKRLEYLTAENRILRAHVKGRLRLADPERRTLAQLAVKLGRKALEELATIVRPETLLRWHRTLVAKKSGTAPPQRKPGRPRTLQETEQLVLRFARERLVDPSACPVPCRRFKFGEKIDLAKFELPKEKK